jgi:hypothetical protein
VAANALVLHAVFGLRVKCRPFELRTLDNLRAKSHELLVEIEDDASPPMEDRVDEASPVNRLAGAALNRNEIARDCGAWWASWVGSSVNFHQATQRCDAAAAALQPVAAAAQAAADGLASGAGHRGREAALRQQSRRLQCALVTSLIADENAEV